MQARWRIRSGLVAGLLVLGMAGNSSAFLIDLDQVSNPRLTQPGAESVGFCTFVSGQTPDAGCALLADFGPIGYLGGSRPFGDFLALPTLATSLEDLWADGHRVFPSGATLRVTSLVAGTYSVTLMSHNPLGNDLDRTVFFVNGAGPFEIANERVPDTDLMDSQTITVPVVVDANGTIDIFYRAGGTLQTGVLNGVTIDLVPEPTSLVLFGIGVAALGHAKRRGIA